MDVDERRLGIAIADVQVFQPQPQPVRIEAHARDAHRAMERGGHARHHEVLRDQRYADEAKQTEDDQNGRGDPDRAPKPSPAAEREAAERRCPCALRGGPDFIEHDAASSVQALSLDEPDGASIRTLRRQYLR